MKKNPEELPPDTIKVGFVGCAHGINGRLFVRLLNPRPDWPSCLGQVFIGCASYSVCHISFHKDGMIVGLKGCESRALAQTLKGRSVFLSKEFFKAEKGGFAYLSELMSFFVEGVEQGPIGRVHSFSFHKGRDFLLVRRMEKRPSQDRTALLPSKALRPSETGCARPSPRGHSSKGGHSPKDSKILIPFVRPYIKAVDFSQKKIIMNLPLNFLDVFA